MLITLALVPSVCLIQKENQKNRCTFREIRKQKVKVRNCSIFGKVHSIGTQVLKVLKTGAQIGYMTGDKMLRGYLN